MWKTIKGNKVHETAIIEWDLVDIGVENTIGPYVYIGGDAQHKTEKSTGKIIIGSGNTIREYTTIHLPTNNDTPTTVGNNCYLMAVSHIAHDCHVEDDVVICNNTALAGHVHIMKNSQIGLNTCIHQYQVIGSYCMIGMGSVITKKNKIRPGTKWAGNPASYIGKNEIGLSRNNVSSNELESEIQRHAKLFEK